MLKAQISILRISRQAGMPAAIPVSVHVVDLIDSHVAVGFLLAHCNSISEGRSLIRQIFRILVHVRCPPLVFRLVDELGRVRYIHEFV